MTKFTLQHVLLRMITPPLNRASGVYYKVRWEQDAGLWAVTKARLPRDHDKTTPYRAEEGVGKLEFFLKPQGKLVIESQFWWKPKVGYRTKSCLYATYDPGLQRHTDEAFYKDLQRYFDEQGYPRKKEAQKRKEELILEAKLSEIEKLLAAIRPARTRTSAGEETAIGDERIRKAVDRVIQPVLDLVYSLRQGAVNLKNLSRCESPDGVDAFYCDPVNVRARHPNLTIVNEHHYLRPLALDLKLEVIGACSHLGRPAVLVRGVPRTIEEQDEMLWVDWWGAPEDWWLVCDYYELAIDMESGLLLYYRGVVGSKTMVQSEMLELVFDPPEVIDESIFRGGQPTR